MPKPIILTTCVLSVALLLCSPLQAASRASCHDPDGPGGAAGEWYALYSMAGGGGRHVQFHELGFRPYAGWNIFLSVPAGAAWQVSVRPLSGAVLDVQQFTTRDLLAGSVKPRFRHIDLYPQLLTPNRHCTLFLRSYDYLAPTDTKPTGVRVAIVGDSLTQAFTAVQKTRRELAQQFAAHNWHMEVSALGGETWQLLPDALPGANMLDEIRGLLTTRPDVFVFALGTNDSLFIAKTRIMKSDIPTQQARRDTVAAIAKTLAEVDAYAPAMCKILVTPSTHPAYLYTQYSEEATFVGDVMRFLAGLPTRTDISDYVKGLQPINNALIADWARASAGPNMAALMPDGIHMKEEAAKHFRALWLHKIAACEKHSQISRRGGEQ